MRPRSAALLDRSDIASRKSRLPRQKGKASQPPRHWRRLSRERHLSVAVVGKRTPAPENFRIHRQIVARRRRFGFADLSQLARGGQILALAEHRHELLAPHPAQPNSRNGPRSNCSASR